MAMVVINAETWVPAKYSTAVKAVNPFDETPRASLLPAHIKPRGGLSRPSLSECAREAARHYGSDENMAE